MGERSVWSLALGDILVIQPVTTLHSMQSMSSSQLRKKATRMVAVDSIFDGNANSFNVIKPAKVQCYTLDHDMARVAAAPAGDWIMTMHGDETVHLHRTEEYYRSTPSGDS